MRFLCVLAGLTMLPPASAAPWNAARTAHFEVFSDGTPDAAHRLAESLERLHAFFVRQVGISPPGVVRVVCFASEAEFNAYRIRPGSGGFSLHTPDRDYIVAPAARDLRVPAHEYAHLLIHSSGWKIPEWLAEGIADVVSSLRIGERYAFLGGDLPGRSGLLKTSRWLTPAELFGTTLKGPQDPAREPLFYAQSWALTEMLIISRDYAPRFPALLTMLAQGSSEQAALEGVYGKSIDSIFGDLRARQAHSPAAMPLPGIGGLSTSVEIATVDSFDSRVMLADLRVAGGDLAQAESIYRALALERPESAEIPAALGRILLERHEAAKALEQWRKALALGVADAKLCYRYAVLADRLGLPTGTIRPALERAIVLQPQYDDALFQLALIDKNEGRAESAVAHLRAMHPPGPDRAWVWSITMADALLDLGRREEAEAAAIEARGHAAGDTERARADQIIWLADTELSVQIAADGQGRKQFRAVRVPVKAPPRNPFFEANDDAQMVEAALEEVQCSGDGLRVVVSTASGRLSLGVPDPSRVQIRKGGGVKFEFVCGPQQSRPVLVEYAAPSTLRGLEFR
jgi:tetratricopeptide (TPR) repeat protein